MITNRTAQRALKTLSVAMMVKAFAGASMAAVATFNVIADSGFQFSPTSIQDTAVAVLGGVAGIVIAAKA